MTIYCFRWNNRFHKQNSSLNKKAAVVDIDIYIYLVDIAPMTFNVLNNIATKNRHKITTREHPKNNVTIPKFLNIVMPKQ